MDLETSASPEQNWHGRTASFALDRRAGQREELHVLGRRARPAGFVARRHRCEQSLRAVGANPLQDATTLPSRSSGRDDVIA